MISEKKEPAKNLTWPCFNHEDFAENVHVKGINSYKFKSELCL